MMSEHVYLQEEEMIRRAIDALLKELGPVETARFLTLPQRHGLDSVVRHRLWQEGLHRERFFDQVFGGQEGPIAPGV
jgi:hypothetical protein